MVATGQLLGRDDTGIATKKTASKFSMPANPIAGIRISEKLSTNSKGVWAFRPWNIPPAIPPIRKTAKT